MRIDEKLSNLGTKCQYFENFKTNQTNRKLQYTSGFGQPISDIPKNERKRGIFDENIGKKDNIFKKYVQIQVNTHFSLLPHTRTTPLHIVLDPPPPPTVTPNRGNESYLDFYFTHQLGDRQDVENL